MKGLGVVLVCGGQNVAQRYQRSCNRFGQEPGNNTQNCETGEPAQV